MLRKSINSIWNGNQPVTIKAIEHLFPPIIGITSRILFDLFIVWKIIYSYSSSCHPQNQMVSTICLNQITDLSRLQFKCYLFKRLLHFSSSKWTQVSSSLTTWALGLLRCNLREELWVIIELLLEVSYVIDGFFSCSCDWFVAIRIEWSSWFLMFLQNVCAMYRHNLNI